MYKNSFFLFRVAFACVHTWTLYNMLHFKCKITGFPNLDQTNS